MIPAIYNWHPCRVCGLPVPAGETAHRECSVRVRLDEPGELAAHLAGQLQPPRQTDAEAANSATPDTDRMPAWNDPDWDSYLWAVDWQYRVDWYMEHGDTEAAQDEVDEHRERSIEEGDWSEDDEEEYIAGGWADDDDDEQAAQEGGPA